jgi:hypothetical protein
MRIISGYHGKKTMMFGAISRDGRQFFGQYNVFNSETLLEYLKKLHRHYGRKSLPRHRQGKATLQH